MVPISVLAFSPIFVFLKLTCLVTLLNSKQLYIFKNSFSAQTYYFIEVLVYQVFRQVLDTFDQTVKLEFFVALKK